MSILRSKQLFFRVLLCFKYVLGHFGCNLGPMTSQKDSYHYAFVNLTSPLSLSPSKAYGCQFLDENDYFSVFYCVSSEFWVILGTIWGQ